MEDFFFSLIQVLISDIIFLSDVSLAIVKNDFFNTL